jgi:hypothetical protein
LFNVCVRAWMVGVSGSMEVFVSWLVGWMNEICSTSNNNNSTSLCSKKNRCCCIVAVVNDVAFRKEKFYIQNNFKI